MKRIFLLIGETGAGKTEIYKRVIERNNIVKAVVSTTTRKPRKGEIEGIDYHFVSDEYFLNNINDFLEYREYTLKDGSKVYYGTHKDSFNDNKPYIHIVDGNGLDSIQEYCSKVGLPGWTVVGVYINASEDIRRERSFNRDNMSEDVIKEIERRIHADAYEVRPYREKCCISLRNNTLEDLETAINVIDNMIYCMSK